jgi:hypothetical protein
MSDLSTEQLMVRFECRQVSKLIQVMRDQNIPFLYNARNRPISSSEAINARLMESHPIDEINF